VSVRGVWGFAPEVVLYVLSAELIIVVVTEMMYGQWYDDDEEPPSPPKVAGGSFGGARFKRKRPFSVEEDRARQRRRVSYATRLQSWWRGIRERRRHGPLMDELNVLNYSIELEEPIVRLIEQDFDRLEIQRGITFDRERVNNRLRLQNFERRAAVVESAVDRRMSTFARQREYRSQLREQRRAAQHALNVLEADAAMAPWFEPAEVLADQLVADPEFQLYLNQ